jgi:hypothetical protein
MFSFHPNTLYSILSQEIQFKIQRTHQRVFDKDNNYYER